MNFKKNIKTIITCLIALFVFYIHNTIVGFMDKGRYQSVVLSQQSSHSPYHTWDNGYILDTRTSDVFTLSSCEKTSVPEALEEHSKQALKEFGIALAVFLSTIFLIIKLGKKRSKQTNSEE